MERGYLVVLQDRTDFQGQELRLPVIVVRATQPSGDAPVVFVSGGPGVGDLSAALYPGAYPFTASRDLVILGRRGTRHAIPSMQCAEIGPRLSAPQSQLNLAIDRCRAEAEADGIDPQFFHSAASAADIDDLRHVLDVEQVALFSLSYGTRLALTYARDFPGRVESMVLDSPLPHSARFDDEFPANVEAALRRVAQLCAAASECDAAYPDLEQRYFHAIRANPDMEVVDLSDRSSLVMAPMRMQTAIGAVPQPIEPGTGSASDLDWGVRLSVWCSEALPFSQRMQRLDETSFGGLDGAVFQPETCARWNVPARPAAEVEPTVSDVPTLVISGELDVLTPTIWGYQAAQTLSMSRVVEIPAGFHAETTNWEGDGCAMSLVAAFFDNPSEFVRGQEPPECVLAQTYPDFVQK